MSRWPVFLLLALLAACATTPVELAQGTFTAVVPNQAGAGTFTGQRVRWGGEILSTTPSKDQTCIEVLSRSLDSSARPDTTSQTQGRFMACAGGFYDPAVYARGREITVVGTLERPMTKKIDDYEYRYPVVRATAVHLWPKEVYYPPYPPYPPYYYDPFYRPWGPWPYWW
jgi:outer membrane lipoprotein